jgi:hypothetical protein
MMPFLSFTGEFKNKMSRIRTKAELKAPPPPPGGVTSSVETIASKSQQCDDRENPGRVETVERMEPAGE